MRGLWKVAAVAVSVLAVTAGCSSSPAPPASPLDSTSEVTCGHDASSCTAPGTLRWSVTVPPQYADSIDDTALSPEYYKLDQQDQQVQVATAPGLLVYQIVGQAVINAVDPATGRHLWTARLPLPDGGLPAGPLSPLDTSLTIAGNEITAYDASNFIWWLVNAKTGAASGYHVLAAYNAPGGTASDAVLPVSPHSVVLLNATNVQAVNPVSNSVLWQMPVQHWTGDTEIGDMLYLDNSPYAQDQNSKSGPTGNERATAIQRVDLATGSVLPALPLAASLQQQGGSLMQVSGEPDALMLESNTTVARLDPATGEATWAVTRPSGAVGDPQEVVAGTTPALAFLVAPPPPGPATFQPPRPGTGTNIYRVMVLSLATGQTSWITLGRSFPYAAADIETANNGLNSPWNMAGSAVLGLGSSGDYIRLEGIDAETGRVLWRGPWAGTATVLAEIPAAPPVIIVESCSPAGLQVDSAEPDESGCDSARLYAVNG